MCRISVIIPVYNTERYVSRCIDSVLAQTLRDIEIIIIDDGSTDGSPGILDSYEGRDSRLRIYHYSNKGIGATRKKGMELANGEYVQFVDSDDWVDSDYLENTYRLASENAADVVETGGFYRHDRFGNYLKDQLKQMPESLSVMSGLDVAKGVVTRTHTCSLCTKLIRKKFCDDNSVSFHDDIGFGEDAYFICRLCSFNPVYVYSNKWYYHVTDNPTSTTKSKYTRKKFAERVRWVNMLYAQYEEESFRDALFSMMFFIKEEMTESGLFAQEEYNSIFPDLRHNLAKVRVNPLRKLLYVMSEKYGNRRTAMLRSNRIVKSGLRGFDFLYRKVVR